MYFAAYSKNASCSYPLLVKKITPYNRFMKVRTLSVGGVPLL